MVNLYRNSRYVSRKFYRVGLTMESQPLECQRCSVLEAVSSMMICLLSRPELLQEGCSVLEDSEGSGSAEGVTAQ